jgi:hypothetical protein
MIETLQTSVGEILVCLLVASPAGGATGKQRTETQNEALSALILAGFVGIGRRADRPI